MAIPASFLDELRTRLALSTVIGRKVKLTRAGREWKACCPFHNEKTPSFTINDEKGFYHCFGCGAHGDIIRFVVEQEGLPFREAVERLALEAGLELPVEEAGEADRRKRASGLHDVMAAASDWFRTQLNGIDGAAARDYLERRGIAPAVRDSFGLGYAPDSRGKLKAALGGTGLDKLIEGGLLIAPEAEPGAARRDPYDRFRGRLMFPIRDRQGRIIAFGGRIIGQGEPKYLNSPDTPLFDKGRTLYNLDRAAAASRKTGQLVVAEGYMDVIALDTAGIAAVAPLGTALTEAQMELLWRQVDVPVLCFDGDAAGQRAAARAALRALPLLRPGKSLSFATLPPGQDPDDIIRSGGRPAIGALLAGPQPLVDRLWAEEHGARPLDTPEARAGLRQRLRDHLRAIADRDVRQAYAAVLAERFDAAFPRRSHQPAPNRSWSPNWQARRPTPPGAPLSALKSLRATPTEPFARAVIIAILEHPELVARHGQRLSELPLDNGDLARLCERLLDLAYAGQKLDKMTLQHTLASADVSVFADTVRKQNRRAAKLNFSFTRPGELDDRAEREFAALLDDLVSRAALVEEVRRIDGAIRKALDEDDDEALQDLFLRQRKIQDEIAGLTAHLRALARDDED